MKHTSHCTDEEVSALMDNAMPVDAAPKALAALLASKEAQASWHRYHLIGDVLRSDSLAPGSSELLFAQRVMGAIGTLPVPAIHTATNQASGLEGAAQTPLRRSANDGGFWLKVMGSTLGVAVLAFLLAGGPHLLKRTESAQQAQGNAAKPQSQLQPPMPAVDVALDEDRPVMTRDPELDALLSAHQQMGGHSALQAPAGFLRNATFDRTTP